MQLRNYQRASLDALYHYWSHNGGNPLIVIPGGGGKSLVMAAACQELLTRHPTLRIAIVTHVRELLDQTFKELVALWPSAPVGLYSAGMGKRDTHTQILIGGIQSIWNKVPQIGGFDIVIVDEVQLVSENVDTMYGQFFKALKAVTPDMRIAGLSATPWRMDSGRLDRGKNRRFDKIVYEIDIGALIQQGYLAPLLSKATATMLDVKGVGKRGGDFIPGQLEVAVDKEWVTTSAVQEIVQFGRDRKRWLLFCSGVQHAFHIRDAVRSHGVNCETVTSETPKNERDSYIRQLRSGDLRCLTNVGILGVGTNIAGLDMIGLLRPTASSLLFYQQVVRGTRLYPGKSDCLILDFALNTQRHGPVDTITVQSSGAKRDEESAPLTKSCPICQTILALAAQQCPTCGHLFPRDLMPKHEALADANTNILSQGKAQWVDVDRVRYYAHSKQGSPNSLRVEYQCGFTTHKEWVCLQHQGIARSRAEQWWLKTGARPIPSTVEEGLRRQKELKQPEQICVRPDGKYFSVVGVRFERLKEAAE